MERDFGKFTASSPVGYATEATDLFTKAVKLIDEMISEEDDSKALMSLAKDKARFNVALTIMYAILQD